MIMRFKIQRTGLFYWTNIMPNKNINELFKFNLKVHSIILLYFSRLVTRRKDLSENQRLR